MLPGVHLLDDDRLGGHLDVLQLGQVGVRPAAQRQDDLLAGVDVVAVDEHLEGFGLAAHAGRCYRLGAPSSLVVGSGAAAFAAARSSRSRRGPRASPRPSTSAPTGRTARRRQRSRRGRRRPRGCRRRGAGRRTRSGSHGIVACSAGYQSSPDQRVLAHDRDAEEGVERQRQHQQQQPERVAHPARDRVDADDRREEQGADDDEVQVHQLVQEVRVQGRVVPAGEVERPRADHEQGEGQRREGQHLGHARVQHRAAAPPRGRLGRVRSASVTGAPSAQKTGTTIDSTMCWTMCTLSSVSSYDRQARAGREEERAHPAHHERQRPPDAASGHRGRAAARRRTR